MNNKLENLKGILKANTKNWGSATHVGAIMLHNKIYYIHGWLTEKEITDEYGKSISVKYFALWATEDKTIKPNKDVLKNKDNIGLLSTNKEKTSNKQPHYKGKVQINGGTYYLGCWKNSREELVDGEIQITTGFVIRAKIPNNSYDPIDYNEQEPTYTDDVPF